MYFVVVCISHLVLHCGCKKIQIIWKLNDIANIFWISTHDQWERVYNIQRYIHVQREITPTVIFVYFSVNVGKRRHRVHFCALFLWNCAVRYWVVDYLFDPIACKNLVLNFWTEVWKLVYYTKRHTTLRASLCSPRTFLWNFWWRFRKSMSQYTYLVQVSPWSSRRWAQAEAFPLHSGWADACDSPKCGLLGHVIFKGGGLRSR